MKIDAKKMTKIAAVAAIYAALTLLLAPISYGPVQFRISEVMVLLAFLDPMYIIGLTIGCFIANVLGPNGMLDVVFGTLATFISVSAITLTRKLQKKEDKFMGVLCIASIWPTLFNGLIIGWMLSYVMNLPLFITMAQVALGEFVVVSLAGVPIFTLLVYKYKHLLE